MKAGNEEEKQLDESDVRENPSILSYSLKQVEWLVE